MSDITISGEQVELIRIHVFEAERLLRIVADDPQLNAAGIKAYFRMAEAHLRLAEMYTSVPGLVVVTAAPGVDETPVGATGHISGGDPEVFSPRWTLRGGAPRCREALFLEGEHRFVQCGRGEGHDTAHTYIMEEPLEWQE